MLEQAQTLKSEGGYGMNFGWIRPRGSLIKSLGIRHPGVVHYMDVWDKVAGVIVLGDNDGYKDVLKNSSILYLSSVSDEDRTALATLVTRPLRSHAFTVLDQCCLTMAKRTLMASVSAHKFLYPSS